MLVESLIALPLLSAGLPPMLVHNLLLLGVIAASGIGMFVLARISGATPTQRIVAGLIFAFAPYRFSHFMHMELQWAVWMPWAFWAMQRTFDTGALRYGVLTGLFMTLQLTSSIYYGLFLAVILARRRRDSADRDGPPPVRPLVSARRGRRDPGRTAWVILRAVPAGERARRPPLHRWKCADSARSHRATSACLNPTACSAGGGPAAPSWPVSGVVPLALGLIALVAMRPTRITLAYATGLAVAVDFSLGINGLIYPHLQHTSGVLQGSARPVLARRSCSCLCLGVLAARAAAAQSLRVSPTRSRALCAAAIAAVILIEYWSAPMQLISVSAQRPAL